MVESDNVRGPRRDTEFEHHIVLRVGEDRPPEVIDRLFVSDLSEASNDRTDGRRRKRDAKISPRRDIVVLSEKRHGKSELEITSIRRQKDLVARTG